MRDERRVRLREDACEEGIQSCPGQEVDSALYASSHPKFVDRARKPRSHREIASLAVGMFVSSLPNIFLNLLRQCFVHRLKVDRGFPEENQQRLEIDIELKFNWHRIAASINRFLQILIR
jgi:hypothetical protein